MSAQSEMREAARQRAYNAKSQWHTDQARLPVEEKVRILLELQKVSAEMIARRRPLKWWEKPWDIEP